MFCLGLLVLAGCLKPVSAAGSDDFSSNLFSDIAPLIALFGEQVAKQYLSQSLGFFENLIFACAPLGILTTVTCAIRVGGPVALRALIGRSQEPAIQVELELLRSTSSDVCELWDGRQVVRLTGSPDIVELVYDEENGAVYGRKEAMHRNPHSYSWWRPFSSVKRAARDFELQELDGLVPESRTAPNISLNGGSIHVNEVRLVALVALTIQIGVVIFFFLSVYNVELSQSISNDPLPDSALPVTVAGTLAVTTGVFICTCVVEARTRLTHWIPNKTFDSLRVMWLQKAQILGDQRFQSCAIFADKSRHEIVSSVYDSKRHLEFWTCLGTAVTTIGFVCQLIGLRQMHYPAAVAQFVATVVMSILRVIIRRHYTRRPVIDYDPTQPLNTFGIVNLSEGHEFCEIAKRLSRCKQWVVYSGFNVDIRAYSEESSANSMARTALTNRLRLKDMFGDFWSSDSDTSLRSARLVHSVANSIDKIMADALSFHPRNSTHVEAHTESVLNAPHWIIEVATVGEKHSMAKLDIPICRDDPESNWKVDKSAVEAVLGMWFAQLYQDGLLRDLTSLSQQNLWLLPRAENNEYEIWQAMMEFMVSEQTQLIPVGGIQEACKQLHINTRNVFHFTSPSDFLAGTRRMAMTTETEIFGMCGQYLIASFLSQNASLFRKRDGTVSLQKPTLGSEHLLLIRDPLFENIRQCLMQTSIFPSESDAKLFAFSVLCQTGDFPDPLLLLPGILNRVTALEKGEAAKICSRVRKLLEWKVEVLLAKSLRVEAAEACLGAMGAFHEVLGFQIAESQKLRDLVKLIMFKFTSTGQRIMVSGPSIAEPSVNDNLRETLAPEHTEAVDEEGFKALITTGDVEMFRTKLLVIGRENPTILNDLLLQAFFIIQNSITTEKTEIIRLLILSGSGCETYRFNSKSVMDFAIAVGNVPLAELVISKRMEKKERELYSHEQLRMAIKNGHGDMVKVLLRSGGDVNAKDPNSGMTALSVAALWGKDSIARYLVSIGASVKDSTEMGENALSLAAGKNHDALGKFLIDEELKASSRHIDSHGVGFQYERGTTSLHFVAAKGNMNLVVALLDAGWDINGGNCQSTPALEATRNKHEHVAKFLIERGCRIDQRLLNFAVSSEQIELVRILLLNGADVNAPSPNGTTALQAAVVTDDNSEGCFDTVKFLLENGADVRIDPSKSLVLKAILKGHENAAMLLIEAGAPLDGRDKHGETILHCAAERGYLNVIRVLITKGVRLDAQDDNEKTALHLAAENDHADVISALLNAKDGEWVDCKDKHQWTALHVAVGADKVGAARALVEHGASMTIQTHLQFNTNSPLAQAVDRKRLEIIKIFISAGATPDEKTHGNIIRTVIRRGDLPIIKALLSVDLESSAARSHPYPNYATEEIEYAIQIQNADSIKLLLELGADITNGQAFRTAMMYNYTETANMLYTHNRTAMLPFVTQTFFNAAKENKIKLLHFWLDHDVPIDVKNNDGQTALHLAANKGSTETAAALLLRDEARSTPGFVNARSKTGATALWTAIDDHKPYRPEKTLEMVKLLVEHGADYRIGLLEPSSYQMEVATPRQYAVYSKLDDVVAYFDEVERGREGGA